MANTVQVRITARVIIAEGRMRVGDVIWVPEDRARQMIEQRVAVAAGAVGPTEFKPKEPAEKKFLPADLVGRSTDSPASSEPGTAGSLFALPEGLVSPRRRSRRARPQENAENGSESGSEPSP